MKIIGVFILITTAVVFLSSVTTVEVSPSTTSCSSNDQCSPPLSCIFGSCANMCDYLAIKGRKCTTKDGKPSFTCDPGYETPKGIDNNYVCLPVEWSCHVDEDDSNKPIKCIPKDWHCDEYSCEIRN